MLTNQPNGVDMDTVLQIAQAVGAALAAWLVLWIKVRKWWGANIAPLLAEIAKNAKGANEAVNNIGPLDQTLRATVESHTDVLKEHGKTLKEHGDLLGQILDAITDQKRR